MRRFFRVLSYPLSFLLPFATLMFVESHKESNLRAKTVRQGSPTIDYYKHLQEQASHREAAHKRHVVAQAQAAQAEAAAKAQQVAQAAARQAQRAQAAKTQRVAAKAAPKPKRSSGGGAPASGDLLDRLAQCECGGNPSCNTGNGYKGTFQYLQSTWNADAKKAGRPDLVGKDPSTVSYADQKQLAGTGPVSGWKQKFPGCARKLGVG